MQKRLLKLLCLVSLTCATPASGQDFDRFRLKTGDDPIEAKPVSWSFQTGSLTMELQDGKTVDVLAADLHPTDMKLVERILKKQLLAARKTGSKPAATTRSDRIKPIGNLDLIHGVKWYDNETDAKSVAQGRDGTRDDRPLVWFRVLGDMTGFM